jgi:hypothetical protein
MARRKGKMGGQMSRLVLLCGLVLCWVCLTGCVTAGQNIPQNASEPPMKPSLSPGESPTSTLSALVTPTPPSKAVPISTLSQGNAQTPAAPAESPDSGWQTLHKGFEKRVLKLFDPAANTENPQLVEQIYIVRLEPKFFTFNLAYHAQPQSLEAWQAETDALIVVNGGFFREEGDQFIPTGLTIVDGMVIGSSYGSFAGMLAITSKGPDLRWLAQQPYDPNEKLISALQSFPILVKPGGGIGFPAQNEDNQKARRTVIAQDQKGRILFILAPQGYFTLHQLSAYLAASDLNLDIAMNLDGGPSSGLLLSDPPETIPAYGLLPLVITVKYHLP